MNWIAKNWPSVVLLLAGVLASIATYVSSDRDSQQKNLIQDLGEQNIKLSKEIDTLNKINNQIATNTQKIGEDNKKLAEDNIALSKQSNDLITSVEKLTETSKQLITKVDKATAYAAEENKQTGELKMSFGSKINDNDFVTIRYGGSTIINTVEKLKVPLLDKPYGKVKLPASM